jgi:hypothetical protein
MTNVEEPIGGQITTCGNQKILRHYKKKNRVNKTVLVKKTYKEIEIAS